VNADLPTSAAPSSPASASSPTPGGSDRDYRVVVACAALAVIAIGAGIAAVVANEAVLGLVAAAIAVLAAGVGALVDVRRSRAEHSLWEARSQARRLRREVDRLTAVASEERSIAGARSLEGELPPNTNTDEWEIDPVSGLIRERHLAVVLQQVVAAARRKVQPVSVIYWELDGFQQAPERACDEALTALGAIAWRTLRESDAVFRIGERAALGVLVDTAEPGAVIVADRVRSSLRTSPVGDTLTVSAGVACYPSHALDAAELVSRAARALDAARAEGDVVDHVVIAPDP
jgi:diguanylate cyclase (GGDEF)-like protein